MFGNLILNSFLAGVGETKTLMKLSLVKMSVGIPLALILIPVYDIVGAILGLVFAEIPCLFLGLYWLQNHYHTKPDFKLSAKIFLAAAIAAIATYLFLNILLTADWMNLTIGGTMFLTIYIFMVPILGVINQKDTQTLRTMFSGLGLISKLINIPLNIAEKVAAFKNT